MTVSLMTSFLIGLGVVILSLLLWRYFGLVRASVKTLPRDILGIYSLFFVQSTCILYKLRNRTVFQIFDQVVARHPDKICFYFEDEEWSFRDVQEYANRIANYFSAQGYRKGDKMALIMDNRPEYVATWLGLSKIGAIASLININLRQESLKHALEVLPHKGIIYEDDIGRETIKEVINLGYQPSGLYCARTNGKNSLPNAIDLDAELKKVSPELEESSRRDTINFDDPLYYSFTSGTTGFPKAAIIKHSRFFLAGLSNVYIIGVKHSDIQYSPLPLYHTTAGMLGLGSALFNGTSIVIRRKFSASQFWKDCVLYHVSVAQYIGETLRYLYSQPPSEYERKHKVRMLFGLGLRKDLWLDFQKRFGVHTIKEFYGSTEGNCNMVNINGKPGCCGFFPRWAYPIMPYRLIRVTEDGEIVRDPKTGRAIVCDFGETGELIGKIYPRDPLRNFEGYSDKQSTEKKIIRDVFSKGDSYFRSGDLLMMDEEGYFYFKDRSGDTFRWKGENVSTQQVELVLSKICDMADVAVYGVKVPGTEGRAGMAALADPQNKIDLQGFAKEICKRLPNYSRPLFLRVKSSLEFTSTHKVKKAELQKEGFNIGIISEPLHFFQNEEYVPLTEHLYHSIITGNTRL